MHCNRLRSFKNKPTMIILNTTKGKDVSFMENNVDFHGVPPNEMERNIAIKELDALQKKVGGLAMSEKKMQNPRSAYGEALIELGEKNKDVVVLDADLSKSTKTIMFAKKYPERFFEMGIAEANMMSAAAGIASCGKIPFVSTFAVFATGRVYDQIRMDIAYSNANVKIFATHGGISVGKDGVSHQMIEDIALMRVLPNMTVIAPSPTASQTKKIVHLMAEKAGPVYARVGRADTPVIYEKDSIEITSRSAKGSSVEGGC
jgi:transketolase C-terminal domain/subunit